MKIAIIGGGAGGFFAALAAKQAQPEAEVTIFERTAKLLSKVRISGGGRCNVTHSCFDPKELVENYPRGSKELLGPFHKFQPADTLEWFEERGVEIYGQEDGRMFPESDSSQTIIDCFMDEAEKLGVSIKLQSKIQEIRQEEKGLTIVFDEDSLLQVDRIILATGSARGGWEIAKKLGHTIQEPLPSLFTFNIPDFDFEELSGSSVQDARVSLKGFHVETEGPLLITHWGFSGPAALKLSAFAAPFLAESDYNATINIDWIPSMSEEDLKAWIADEAWKSPAKPVMSLKIEGIPKKLWKALCYRAGIRGHHSVGCISNLLHQALLQVLKGDQHQVKGKTTNKEEFVTCGGITLSEVNFKTMESKCCPGLHFAGEVLNIDGVTGGFNFQNAWTTGWIAGHACV